MLTEPRNRTWHWVTPIALATLFTLVVQGLGYTEFLPLPVALLAGAVWGILIGSVAYRLSRNARRGAWLEDSLVFAGTIVMGFASFGAVLGLLTYRAAFDSSSLTGETMVAMFVPSIPYFIIVNSILELLIIPALLVVGWRSGVRRNLIVAAAALYFAQRVWTYIVFVPERLAFAERERSTVALTEQERRQAYEDLMLDDPRWIVNLVIVVLFLLAAHYPRLRTQAGHPTT